MAEARRLCDRKRLTKAGELLAGLLRKKPPVYRAHVEWVRCLYRAGKAREAVKRYRGRTAFAPRSGVAWFGMGLALAATGKREEAETAFARAAKLAPREPEIPYRAGLLALKTKDWPKALEHLSGAVKLKPKRADLRVALAMALHKSGKRKEAVGQLGEMADLEPSPRTVRRAGALMTKIEGPNKPLAPKDQRKLVRATTLLHRYDATARAMAILRELRVRHGRSPVVAALLGLTYLRVGEHARAIIELRAAVRLRPGVGRYHAYIGDVYAAMRRKSEAVASFTQAVQLDPVNGRAHLRLGKLLAGLGSRARARKALRRAMYLLPNSSGPGLILGRMLVRKGKLKEAERTLGVLRRRFPKDARWRIQLAAVATRRAVAAKSSKDQKRLLDQARELLRRARSLAPKQKAAVGRALKLLDAIEKRLEKRARRTKGRSS